VPLHSLDASVRLTSSCERVVLANRSLASRMLEVRYLGVGGWVSEGGRVSGQQVQQKKHH
jgi:hypothetical protein